MEFNIRKGLKGEKRIKVEDRHTAAHFGSGGVCVLATPVMIGLMEGASLELMAKHLPEGYTTVGTSVNIKHLAATPVGMEVIAKTELIEIDGRRLVFKVEAFDEVDKIGEGIHERFIVDEERFMKKNEEKKAKR